MKTFKPTQTEININYKLNFDRNYSKYLTLQKAVVITVCFILSVSLNAQIVNKTYQLYPNDTLYLTALKSGSVILKAQSEIQILKIVNITTNTTFVDEYIIQANSQFIKRLDTTINVSQYDSIMITTIFPTSHYALVQVNTQQIIRTNVKEASIFKNIKLYYSNNSLYLNDIIGTRGLTMRMYNLTGVIVEEKNIDASDSNNSLVIPVNLPNGIYVIKIYDNEFFQAKKISIQN